MAARPRVVAHGHEHLDRRGPVSLAAVNDERIRRSHAWCRIAVVEQATQGRCRGPHGVLAALQADADGTPVANRRIGILQPRHQALDTARTGS